MDKGTSFRDDEGALYVLHKYPSHDVEDSLRVGELLETEYSSFALSVDVGPSSDQRAVMRKDLSRLLPSVETGQDAIKVVVRFLHFVENHVLILYGFVVVA